MSPWLLLIALTLVWCLWVVAAAAQVAAEDARRGIPEDRWRGVSPATILPVPFVFWGLAWGIDRVAEPWGTRIVGLGHAVFALVLVASLVRDVRTIRSIDDRARSALDAPRHRR